MIKIRTFCGFGHFVSEISGGRNLLVILDQKEFILFELLVDVFLSGKQKFVGRFGDFSEESADDLFLILSSNVQVLVVLLMEIDTRNCISEVITGGIKKVGIWPM